MSRKERSYLEVFHAKVREALPSFTFVGDVVGRRFVFLCEDGTAMAGTVTGVESHDYVELEVSVRRFRGGDLLRLRKLPGGWVAQVDNVGSLWGDLIVS